MGCGAKNPAGDIRAQQKRQQRATEQAVAGIDKAFSGFNEPFYNKVTNSYLQFALPELQRQYQRAQGNMTFNLAGQGLGQSSAAQRAAADLSGAQSRAQTQVGQSAVDEANRLRQQIGQERAGLISQAQGAQYPGALTQQALATAATTQAPSTFAPLGQMFSGLGNVWLANRQANMYNQFAQDYLGKLGQPTTPSFGNFGSFNYQR